jgi:hypothetical protein
MYFLPRICYSSCHIEIYPKYELLEEYGIEVIVSDILECKFLMVAFAREQLLINFSGVCTSSGYFYRFFTSVCVSLSSCIRILAPKLN